MENQNNKSRGLGVASLTLGIISVLTHILWYMGLITGILAIVFGAKSLKFEDRKTGKAGLILGIIGLSLTVLVYASLVVLLMLSKI